MVNSNCLALMLPKAPKNLMAVLLKSLGIKILNKLAQKFLKPTCKYKDLRQCRPQKRENFLALPKVEGTKSTTRQTQAI